ncbi:hypothetical protein Tco_0629831 [Tanacetum coccineum]|uniref:Uncharacterized protein n=1 Tax=Tanacetum coccineum TaxID=301880 RepID=A0ABQ4WU93_9ASTR
MSSASQEFEASEPSGTRTVSSHSPISSDSTAPLSPDHPLTHVSPTSTPTRVSFHPALSLSSFCKRYRSSYKTPSPSSSPILPVQKRYRGTSQLILDNDSDGDKLGEEDTKEDEEDESSDADDERERESQGLDDEGQGLDDEGQGLDDEGKSLEDEGPSIEEEEEAAPEGQ